MSSYLTQIKDFAREALPVLGIGFSAATTLFGWKRFVGTDVKELSTEQRTRIEDAIKQFSAKLGITKEIKVIELKPCLLAPTIDCVIAQAFGCNALPGNAGVKVSVNQIREFELALDKKLQTKINMVDLERFMIAHELSHIQQNHNLKLFVVSTCLYLFQRSLCQSFSRGIISNLALKALCWTPLMLYSQHCEKQADQKAFEVLSYDEWTEAINFMELLPSSFDPIHPSSQARAAYMRQWSESFLR